MFFKIKSTTQLKKLMDAYCQRQSVYSALSSLLLPTWGSFSMGKDCMRAKLPRTWTWRMEMRLTWWLNRQEEGEPTIDWFEHTTSLSIKSKVNNISIILVQVYSSSIMLLLLCGRLLECPISKLKLLWFFEEEILVDVIGKLVEALIDGVNIYFLLRRLVWK